MFWQFAEPPSLFTFTKDHDTLYRFDARFSLHQVPSFGLDAVRVQ